MTRSMLMLLACAAGGLAQTSEWKLTWRDEFDGAKLDPSKWEYVVDVYKRQPPY